LKGGPVQWLQNQARDNSACTALKWAGEEISFSSFLEHVEASRPKGEGRLLVVQQGSALDLATQLFAAPMAGNAFMPLDPRMPAERARALVELAESDHRFHPLPPDPSAIHLVIATSGTTGTPKGVMLTGANLAASALASRRAISLDPGDRWLACLPLFHIGGLSILIRCVEAGATAILHEGFDVEATLAAMEDDGATHVSLVPTMLLRLLEATGDKPPPGRLKTALVGGAVLSRPLAKRAREAGWPIAPTYGMSETASQCATRVTLPNDWQEGDVGRLLNGFEADLDEGLLKLRGPAVMAGYLTEDRRLGEGLKDGWFKTSDLAELSAEGAVKILGRADDVLISGGENIHPTAVESILSNIDGIDEVAIIGMKDPEWGESLLALFVGSLSEQEFLGKSAEKLSGPYRPRRALKVSSLPRNTLGKLGRVALKEIAKEKATLF